MEPVRAPAVEKSASPAERHKASAEAPKRAQLSRSAGAAKPAAATQAAHEEAEDLEIPAFLKRQAN